MNTQELLNQITTLIEQKQLAVNELTKNQLAEAMRQALLSGDFIRHCRIDGEAQTVVYLPYWEMSNLEKDNALLRAVFRAADDLEAWLGANAGHSDEWPIEIKADEGGAMKLATLLNDLKLALEPLREKKVL